MNVRLRMYKYCYSNEGAIYAKGLYQTAIGTLRSSGMVFELFWRRTKLPLN